MYQKITTRLILFTTMVTAAGCYYDKAELLYPGSNQPADCSTIAATFGANVLPLVVSKCAIATCHDATASGGVVLQNYSQISSVKDRINTRVVVEKTMPPTGPLQPAEINILQCWIASGAPNN